MLIGDVARIATRLDSVLSGADDSGTDTFSRFPENFLGQTLQMGAHVFSKYWTNISIGLGVAVIHMLGDTP